MGFRMLGIVFRVSGVRISGFEFRTSGVGFRVSALDFRVAVFGRGVSSRDFVLGVSGGSGFRNRPGGNPGANLKSITHRIYLREVAFEYNLT